MLTLVGMVPIDKAMETSFSSWPTQLVSFTQHTGGWVGVCVPFGLTAYQVWVQYFHLYTNTFDPEEEVKVSVVLGGSFVVP